LMNYSGTNFCYPLSDDASLRDVINSLAGNCARVPILTKRGLFDIHRKQKLKHFLTKTDILQFINSNLDLFGTTLDDTLQGSGYADSFQKLHSVPQSKITVDAFREMVASHISSVAVVDEKGKLVGSLSARDVRFFLDAPQDTIELPLSEFLSKIQTFPGYVSCSSGHTLRHTITLMKGADTHRVWIVDDKGVPTGVFSISDVMRFLSKVVIPGQKHTEKEHVKQEHRPTFFEMQHLKHVVEEAFETSSTQEQAELATKDKKANDEGTSTRELREWSPDEKPPEEKKAEDMKRDAEVVVQFLDTQGM